tara:strand:- start:218 stop:574 length:357 start_codon:yes stop_codon:yes gene_type:complete
MIDTELKRELMLFGAYLADAGGIRSRLTSNDFVDNDIAACIEELEAVASGRKQQHETRFLPAFLKSLEVSNGGDAIEGVEQTVKANAEYKRLRKYCRLGALSSSPEDLERIKKQFQSA